MRRRSNKGKDDDGEDESPDETLENFEQRLNLFVQIHLARASSSKRDHYKDALVFQTRKDLIQEFRKVIQVKKCQNEGCGAYVFLNSRLLLLDVLLTLRTGHRHGFTFRKEGHTKIIEYELSSKQKMA